MLQRFGWRQRHCTPPFCACPDHVAPPRSTASIFLRAAHILNA
jgi:hypothetical protein